MIPDLSRLRWRKSSYSGSNGGSCVEVAHLSDDGSDGLTAVRDSKNPNGGFLLVSESSWARFLATASRDGFRRK
jgi:hypothetical protein